MTLRHRRMVTDVKKYFDAAAVGWFAGECGQRTFRRVRDAADHEVQVTVLIEVAPTGGETYAAELVESGLGRDVHELPGPGVSPESRAGRPGHDEVAPVVVVEVGDGASEVRGLAVEPGFR